MDIFICIGGSLWVGAGEINDFSGCEDRCFGVLEFVNLF